MLFRIAFISVLFVSLFAETACADVGETFDLKQQRATLLMELEEMRAQGASAEELLEKQTRVIRLDEQLFSSYEETATRLSAHRNAHLEGARKSTIVMLVALLLFLLSMVMLVMARQRLAREGTTFFGVFRGLLTDFINGTAPAAVRHVRQLHVSPVLIAGLLMMGASVIAFLFTRL